MANEEFNIDTTLESIKNYQLNGIHNTTSEKLGANRELDGSLNIDKSQPVTIGNNALNIETSLDVSYFQNKRPISRQLSDSNDQKLLDDIKNVNNKSFERDELLANALNEEDTQREIADAQLKEDLLKEALDRIDKDALLAQAIAKYKDDMSQYVETKNLRVTEDIYAKDDSGIEEKYSDIIGSIKNALVKDFKQSYDPSTGKLISTIEFKNIYTDNEKRPTTETLTSTVSLDLEKFIVDIDDVYATKTEEDGVVSYTELDISTLTPEELEEIESLTYDGNVKRCLKVTYNTLGNENAGAQKSYVYFEVNDIFRSTIVNLNNKIADLNNKIDELYQYLFDNTKTVTLNDAAGNELYKFKSFASPEVKGQNTDHTEDIDNNSITLPTITVN